MVGKPPHRSWLRTALGAVLLARAAASMLVMVAWAVVFLLADPEPGRAPPQGAEMLLAMTIYWGVPAASGVVAGTIGTAALRRPGRSTERFVLASCAVLVVLDVSAVITGYGIGYLLVWDLVALVDLCLILLCLVLVARRSLVSPTDAWRRSP